MNSRKQISLEQKIKIIEDIDSGMRQSEIVKKYDLKQSTWVALQHLEDLKQYLSCLPGLDEKYFNSLDAIREIFIKKYEFSKKQSKITDFLKKKII